MNHPAIGQSETRVAMFDIPKEFVRLDEEEQDWPMHRLRRRGFNEKPLDTILMVMNS
jgi:hypothetical protein